PPPRPATLPTIAYFLAARAGIPHVSRLVGTRIATLSAAPSLLRLQTLCVRLKRRRPDVGVTQPRIRNIHTHVTSLEESIQRCSAGGSCLPTMSTNSRRHLRSLTMRILTRTAGAIGLAMALGALS